MGAIPRLLEEGMRSVFHQLEILAFDNLMKDLAS